MMQATASLNQYLVCVTGIIYFYALLVSDVTIWIRNCNRKYCLEYLTVFDISL